MQTVDDRRQVHEAEKQGRSTSNVHGLGSESRSLPTTTLPEDDPCSHVGSE